MVKARKGTKPVKVDTMIRTTLTVDRALWASVHTMSVLTRQNMNSIVVAALEKYIRENV